LRRTGPMAVSSANISGKPAALTCDEAIEQLGDSVAIYLDGGPLSDAAGAPSTIVDFTRHEDGQVLRRGAITVETLRQTVPNLLDLIDEEVGEGAPPTGSDQDEDAPAPGSSGLNSASGG
jgi:L-threonylcarbamoyladenylate synthase